MPRQYSRLPLATRLWQRVHKTAGCWRWCGAVTIQGYGHLYSGVDTPLTVQAHRVSWEVAYGPIPEGLLVLHRCDVRRCVNPAHLFLGTQAENLADMDAKGRRRTVAPAGERHGQARLTEATVREIRDAWDAGVSTIAALARRYGIGQTTARHVVYRESWKHLP